METNFVHPPRSGLGNRFSQPAKSTLISWINEKNNRGFYPSQFTFRDPIPIDYDGTVDIPFIYNDTGEESKLRVQRVNIGLVPGLQDIVIHSTAFTVQSILDSIFEQYGLFLDPDMVAVKLNKIGLDDALSDGILDGFDIGGRGVYSEGSHRLELLDCTITMKDNHLVYEGEIFLKIRKSLLTNTDTISRMMDLREFYSQSDEMKPYVETYQPCGLWTVDESDKYVRREIESRLYSLGKDGIVDYRLLSRLLSDITNNEWVSDNIEAPFNIMNSRVLYNGLSSEHPGIAPISHSYLLILELSDLCENLQGRIHIAYRYSRPTHPIAYPGGYNYIR